MKKNSKMIWKNGFLLVMMVLLTFRLSVSVQASDAKVVSTLVSQDEVYVYVSGISDIQSGSSVQIGNVICDSGSISAAAVSDLTVSMRTIILIDNSLSIPSANHADIQEILLGLVDNALDNEQIRIATFSDEVVYLNDFTNDKEALRSIVEGISYNNQQTYLSDVLYDVISDLDVSDCVYTRILVISDGADDKAIGYTNEEVRNLISDSPYPVYTIGTQTSSNSSELETMFSFSRASSADYFLLDGETSNAEIIDSLMEDQNNLCVRIVLDESVKDGSNKKILLTLITSEGTVELVTDADMPFGSGTSLVAEEAPEEEEEVVSTLPTLAPTTEEEVVDEEEKEGISPLIFVIIGVIVVLLIIVIILVIVRKKKTKKQEEEPEEIIVKQIIPEKPQKQESFDDASGGETVFAGEDLEGVESGGTIAMWSTEKHNYIVLTNLDMPGVTYESRIENVVRIGRADADIIIQNDKQVSRPHCDIILRGNLLYLKDDDSTNGTFYEMKRVHDEVPIMSGGNIKIGRYHYRVDLMEKSAQR